jgi:hypothetical protein
MNNSSATNVEYVCGGCDFFNEGSIDWNSFAIGVASAFLFCCVAPCIGGYLRRVLVREDALVQPIVANNTNNPELYIETNRLNVNAIIEEKKTKRHIEIDAEQIQSPKHSVTRRNVVNMETQTEMITPVISNIKYQNIFVHSGANVRNINFK